MNGSIFLSKSTVFSGDCGCDLHNREHEPTQRLHYHDFYEVIVYLGSAASFVMEGREFPVRRGDIVLVSMFTDHMVVPDKEDEDVYFIVAHVNPELLITYSTPSAHLLDIFSRRSNPVHTLHEREFAKYRRLMDEYKEVHDKNGRDILIKAIVHQLMAYAYSDCFIGSCRADKNARDITVVTRIIHYINLHLTEKFSLAALASEINYSESYICHLFKAATNKTITNYIQEKRIEMASGLLHSSTPIVQIAEQAGFRNYSHFYKTFKRQMGENPAEYRARLQEQAR